MDRFYAGGRRQTYYELFKACRLCGSGGGYKMPIIQASAAHDAEPELRHKIKDCCSIDVQQEDKMPPLICELCVDKVNDFYEFREMCRATNIRVRSSLGLPPQTLTQEVSEDCILGVSGPLIYSSKELELSQAQSQKPKAKEKRGAKQAIVPKRALSPPPPIILSAREKRSLKKEAAKPAIVQSLLAERTNPGNKRRRGSEPVAPPPPIKKLRFSADLPTVKKSSLAVQTRAEKRSAPSPPANERKYKEPAPPPMKKSMAAHPCTVCKQGFSKPFLLKQHLTSQHIPTVLSEKLGCAPCKEWFLTLKNAEDHHKWHKASRNFYQCSRCLGDFKLLQTYNRHFALRQCIPNDDVPDPQCTACQKTFVTENLMKQHKCAGPNSVGGQCSKCKKHFPRRPQLKRHQSKCKGPIASPEVNPNNPHLKSLKLVQITMPKCDNLLQKIKRESNDDENGSGVTTYDVSGLPAARNSGILIKTEPFEDGFNEALGYDMDIKQEIKEEYPDYASNLGDVASDYDSAQSESDDADHSHVPNLVINPFARINKTKVESLSIISLRSIFSDNTVKRKPRQKRRIPKSENLGIQVSVNVDNFDAIVSKKEDKTHEENITTQNTSVEINPDIENIQPEVNKISNETQSIEKCKSDDSNLIDEINLDSSKVSGKDIERNKVNETNIENTNTSHDESQEIDPTIEANINATICKIKCEEDVDSSSIRVENVESTTEYHKDIENTKVLEANIESEMIMETNNEISTTNQTTVENSTILTENTEVSEANVTIDTTCPENIKSETILDTHNDNTVACEENNLLDTRNDDSTNKTSEFVTLSETNDDTAGVENVESNPACNTNAENTIHEENNQIYEKSIDDTLVDNANEKMVCERNYENSSYIANEINYEKDHTHEKEHSVNIDKIDHLNDVEVLENSESNAEIQKSDNTEINGELLESEKLNHIEDAGKDYYNECTPMEVDDVESEDKLGKNVGDCTPIKEMESATFASLNVNTDAIDGNSIKSLNKELSEVTSFSSLNENMPIVSNIESMADIEPRKLIENEIEEKVLDDKSSNEIEEDIEMLDEMPSRISDNADMDFDIDSMFQGELGPLATKKQSEILHSKVASTDIAKNTIEETTDENQSKININAQEIAEDTTSVINDNSTVIVTNTADNSTVILNNMNNTSTVIVTNTDDNSSVIVSNTITKVNDDLKSDQEAAFEKTENDILDLVSDSGDDCNIIDSPEKIKSLEDQLLAEDIEDSKDCPSSEITSSALNEGDIENIINENQIIDKNSDFEDISSLIGAKDNIDSCIEASSADALLNDIQKEETKHDENKDASIDDIAKSLQMDSVSDGELDLGD